MAELVLVTVVLAVEPELLDPLDEEPLEVLELLPDEVLVEEEPLPELVVPDDELPEPLVVLEELPLLAVVPELVPVDLVAVEEVPDDVLPLALVLPEVLVLVPDAVFEPLVAVAEEDALGLAEVPLVAAAVDPPVEPDDVVVPVVAVVDPAAAVLKPPALVWAAAPTA